MNSLQSKNIKIVWRRNAGDNEPTLDTYMWVNGKPTDNLISPCSGCYYVYFNNRQIGVADSLKEAKLMLLTAGGYEG